MYKHQVVNDLAFIFSAPLIYQDVAIEAYWCADYQEKLMLLDQDPKPLEMAIAQCRSHFLGSYFEVLFSFALTHFSRLTLIFEHQQIASGGKTLGEVDALVRTPAGQVFQFEVAIKFYLASDTEAGHWIGPNKRDSFRQKYQRAKTHQLQILSSKAAKDTLLAYQVQEVVDAHLLMFGFLYQQIKSLDDIKYCSDEQTQQAPLLHQINPMAQSGYWIREDALACLQADFISAQELVKPHWLSNPVAPSQGMVMHTDFVRWQTEITSGFLQDDRPRHFFIHLHSENAKAHGLRLFVVPSQW